MRNLLSTRIAKLSSLVLLLNLGLILGLILAAALPTLSVSANSPSGGGGLTGYYNLFGYEGIGTLGAGLTTNGQTPAVGDYVSTHCRYINVTNTTLGQYYLRYPLHLPNGSTITKVSLFVADFTLTGSLWAYLRTRPWNSRDAGSTASFTLSDNATNNDKTINMTPSGGVLVNNQTTEYWIDVSPYGAGADPGQLCVYGIQVTYTVNGAFLPLVQKGG